MSLQHMFSYGKKVKKVRFDEIGLTVSYAHYTD